MSKSIAQLFLEHQQDWSCDHLTGEFVPSLDHLLSQELFHVSAWTFFPELPRWSFKPFPRVLTYCKMNKHTAPAKTSAVQPSVNICISTICKQWNLQLFQNMYKCNSYGNLDLTFKPLQLEGFLLSYSECFYWGAVEVQLTQQASLYILLSVRLV